MQRSILLCLSESFYFHNMIIGILFDFVNNLVQFVLPFTHSSQHRDRYQTDINTSEQFFPVREKSFFSITAMCFIQSTVNEVDHF